MARQHQLGSPIPAAIVCCTIGVGSASAAVCVSVGGSKVYCLAHCSHYQLPAAVAVLCMQPLLFPSRDDCSCACVHSDRVEVSLPLQLKRQQLQHCQQYPGLHNSCARAASCVLGRGHPVVPSSHKPSGCLHGAWGCVKGCEAMAHAIMLCCTWTMHVTAYMT